MAPSRRTITERDLEAAYTLRICAPSLLSLTEFQLRMKIFPCDLLGMCVVNLVRKTRHYK